MSSVVGLGAEIEFSIISNVPTTVYARPAGQPLLIVLVLIKTIASEAAGCQTHYSELLEE